MAYGSISAKQQEILNYIKSEIINRGYPPAVRDICEAVHLKSTSSVHAHLEALEKNGYIRKDPTKPRAIEVVDEGFNAVRRELVNVPLVGTVAAGQPLLAVENIESYFPVPAEYLPNQQTFMLRVKGESMINAGILDWSQPSRMPATVTWSLLSSMIRRRSKLSTVKTATYASSPKTTRWIRSS